jgi:hypothetical protein
MPERNSTEPEFPVLRVEVSITTEPERSPPMPDITFTLPLVPLEEESPETRLRDPPTIFTLSPDLKKISPPVWPVPALKNTLAACVPEFEPAVPTRCPDVSSTDLDFIVSDPDERPRPVINVAIPEAEPDADSKET